MKLRALILFASLMLCVTGCFGKYPDLRMDIKRLKKNLLILRKDYEPLKNSEGKVIGKAAHRPFGDDEKENDESCKNRLNLFDESENMCDDMIKASKGGE